MKKKIALLFSVLLFIGFFFFFVFYSKPVQTSEPLEKGAFAEQVRRAEELKGKLTKPLDMGKARLCFKGEELAYDQESRTFYLPVDMDCRDWEAGGYSSAEADTKVLPLLDYTLLDKQEAVADGRAFPFLAFQEQKSASLVVYVVFTGLPVVRLETDADLEVDTVFAGSIVFYEACGREDWTLYSAYQAHERGQTTRAYPKKGYRVELITVTPTGNVRKNSQGVLGMRDSDSWIFYAIYSDGTKIRDKFNIELWNQFGASDTPFDAHFGTHMEYVELVANGEYRGLYGILEPIDTSQLQISGQEYLYKRTYGRELLPELFDEVPPEEYLTVSGMEIKGREGAGTRADWRCFQDFTRMCAAGDEEFKSEAERLLDMDNMANLWIYLQALYAEDNIYKNMFFAFKKEAFGYRLYLVPWDMDLSWGNVYVDSAEELYVMSAPKRAEEYLEWPFADRLLSLDVGGLKERIQSRYQELRKGVLSEGNMERLMEECIHQVQDSGAFRREALRWPKGRHDGDYRSMENFMEERMETMDKWVE